MEENENMDYSEIVELKRKIAAMDMCITAGNMFCPMKCEKCTWNVDTDKVREEVEALITAYKAKKSAQ